MTEETRKHKKHNKIIWLLIAIIVIAVGFIFINSQYLSRSPFEAGIAFDEPDYAAMNEAGYKAVIDSFGSRVLVITPDDKLAASIEYSSLSKVSPKSAKCLAIDEDTVYIMDSIMNPDGESASGERILAYGFNGRCKGTLFVTSGQENAETFRIVSVACDSDCVYAAGYLEDDENSVIVADVTDGTFSPIHMLSYTEGVPFEYTYQPKPDITTIVTYDGKICSYKGDDVFSAFKPDGQIDKVLYLDNGDIAALDVNDNTIALNESVAAKTDAESFDVCGNTLVYADPNAYTVSNYDAETDTEEVLASVPYTTGIRIWGYLTWGAAAIGVLALILLIVLIIVSTGKKPKRNDVREDDADKKLLTTGRLYGNTFLIMIIVFAVTSFMIGKIYYTERLERVKTETIETAYRISKTSHEGFGDALVQVDSQEAYGSEEYNAVCDHVDQMCLSGVQLDNKNAMTCSVFCFEENSDAVIVVMDPSDYNRVGTRFSAANQETRQIKLSMEIVKEGYFDEATVKYDNGIKLYSIYSPVYDSEGRIVGATAVTTNLTGVIEDIVSVLSTKLLEIFTLLAGLCMLFAEIRYGLIAVRIKKAMCRKGIKNATVVEADRTVNIMIQMPAHIFIMFYTLLVLGILKENGLEGNAFLLALPITLNGIVFAVGRTFGASIAKHNPKKSMYLSTTLTIIGYIVCIAARSMSSYGLIIAGGCITGAATPIGFGAGRATKLSGKQPADEYRFMVFSNVEGTISGAIGVALGAVVRGIYGDFGLMALAIVICLVTYPIVYYFVGNDIAVAKETTDNGENRKPSIFETIRRNAHILKSPQMISATLLSTLPIGFLIRLSTYVMPLFNEYEGLPDVAIGTITLAIKLFALFVIPIIIRWRSGSGIPKLYVLALGMGVVAIFLLPFGLDATMKTLVMAMLVIALMKVLVPNVCDDIFIEESKKAGIAANDLIAVWEFCYNIGSYAAPMVFTFMMGAGRGCIGYCWCIICAVCAVLILLLSGFKVKKPKN